ncbi:MAG: hypothetical protein ISR58_05290 [Anaerolineales bacterium]|nr:hypothetical protein [Chloroflexota bacterium]MBL6980588.1 hypothetical protein [Anaerolineales bacterium]
MDKKFPAQSLKKAICYYYLLAFCQPEKVKEFKKTAQPLRENIAKHVGLKMKQAFERAAPEVARHIVAFHQNTRNPDEEWVKELASKIAVADKSSENVEDFQMMLGLVSRLPQRAKPENRLHHRRGCQFCAVPCHYGYFSLVSEPRFEELQSFIRLEFGKSPEYMKPITAVRSFALTHIEESLGINRETIPFHPEQLANLAYCLLALATAKSRLPVPEKQFQLFQAANQNINLVRA